MNKQTNDQIVCGHKSGILQSPLLVMEHFPMVCLEPLLVKAKSFSDKGSQVEHFASLHDVHLPHKKMRGDPPVCCLGNSSENSQATILLGEMNRNVMASCLLLVTYLQQKETSDVGML